MNFNYTLSPQAVNFNARRKTTAIVKNPDIVTKPAETIHKISAAAAAAIAATTTSAIAIENSHMKEEFKKPKK